MRYDKENHPDVCRVLYTPVSEELKEVVAHFKLTTNATLHSLRLLQDMQLDPHVRRLLALAYTSYEEGCMWAVKACTSDAMMTEKTINPTQQQGPKP